MALTTAWKNTASMLTLLMATSAMAANESDIASLIPEKGKTCVGLAALKNPATPVQSYLSRLFEIAGVSLEMPKMPGRDFQVCVDPILNRMGHNGYYNQATDTIMLDPSRVTGEVQRHITVAHEMRHRQQGLNGLNPYRDGLNVPGHERVIMMFATEADARVNGVVLADKMRQLGHPEYVAKLMKDDVTRPQMAAYDRALQKNPGDIDRAKRAVVYAFLNDPALTRSYALEMMGGWQAGFSFQAKRTVDSLVGDATLRKLGGYVDEALIRDLRKSFSPADFERLAAQTKAIPGSAGLAK